MQFFSLLIFINILFFFISCGKPEKDKSFSADFQLLYYANLNGNIENCNCGEPPLGGLDRIASSIKKHRLQNPEILVIDGGDAFNTYSFTELNTAILQIYQIIKPDIWILADQEFIEGAEFISSNSIPLKFQTLSSLSSERFEVSNKKKIISKDGKTALFYSYVEQSLDTTLFKLSLQEIVLDSQSLPDDFIKILIFHGFEQSLERQISSLSDFDLILTAHMQNQIIDLDSKPAIINGFADGEQLILISLQKSLDKLKINVDLQAVAESIEPMFQVTAIVESFKEITQSEN